MFPTEDHYLLSTHCLCTGAPVSTEKQRHLAHALLKDLGLHLTGWPQPPLALLELLSEELENKAVSG